MDVSPEEKEDDIEAIKLLFFDPKYGGSRELRGVVEDYVASYQQALAYINKSMPAQKQREIEDDEYWFSPEKLEAQISGLLGVRHIHVPQEKEKFFKHAQALGLIGANEAYDGDVAEEYSYQYATALSRDYASKVQISQVLGRK